MTIRIAHISDIHWRGITRHKEYKQAFKVLYDELRELNPSIIINTGDTFHTKTQGITPEVVYELSRMFEELANIAPTYTILGNHDGNLTNLKRLDMISPIHSLINNSNAILLKESGVYKIDNFEPKIALGVFSVFDKENWDKVTPQKGYVNVALFHGSISGCKVDNNWHLPHGEQEVMFFKDFDFVLLGDIHKNQYIDTRLAAPEIVDAKTIERYNALYEDFKSAEELPDGRFKVQVNKPWIAYPGSLIQQNHGEDIKKGYLVWDIDDKDHWNVEWKHLVNMAPFVTITWEGSIEKTIKKYTDLHKNYSFMPGTRFRVLSKNFIPQAQSRELVKKFVEEHEAEEVVFKTDIVSRMDQIDTGGTKVLKKSLATDPGAIFDLYKKYLDAHSDQWNKTDIDEKLVYETIESYLGKLSKSLLDEARGVTWSLNYLKFDNLFGYGEKNYVDFAKHKGIVGIFGKNRIGKSSIIGAILYTLFNTTDRGSIKNNHIINDNKDWCSGEVGFFVGSEEYVVERRSNKVSKSGKLETSTTSVSFWKIRNDGCQKIKVSANGISRDDTDAIIRKKIGTAEDFLLTAFAAQGKLNNFIENKATKRKEFLNRFLELDVFNKLYSLANDDFTRLNNLNGSYSIDKWNFEYSNAEKNIARIQSQIASHDEKIHAAAERKDKLKFWVAEQDKKASLVDTSHITEIEDHITALEGTVASLEKKLQSHDLHLKESKRSLKLLQRKKDKIDIGALRSDLIAMDQVKNSMNSLNGTLKVEEASLVQQEKSIMKLKVVPCGNQFPTCHFIKDGHEAKNTVDEQRRLVRSLSKSVTDATKTFDKYAKRNIQKMIEEYEEIRSQIPILESTISSTSSLIENDTQLLKSKKFQLRNSKSKLTKTKRIMKSVLSEDYTRKKEFLKSAEQALATLSDEKNNLLISLGSQKHKIEKLEEEKEHNKDIICKLHIFNSIQQAFSKNGIPAMILMGQLPAINKEIARVLNNIVDFNITLETDVSSNIMDIYIEDGKSKRLIELGSGMEKTICSIALRVALGNLSSLARPDILVLDESFGALDEDNLIKGMELLSLFSGHFKAIYVITHIAEIKETANKIIEIKNNGIESKVKA